MDVNQNATKRQKSRKMSNNLPSDHKVVLLDKTGLWTKNQTNYSVIWKVSVSGAKKSNSEQQLLILKKKNPKNHTTLKGKEDSIKKGGNQHKIQL